MIDYLSRILLMVFIAFMIALSILGIIYIGQLLNHKSDPSPEPSDLEPVMICHEFLDGKWTCQFVQVKKVDDKK